MAIDESLKKLTKIFDQDVEITGTLEVGGSSASSTDIANWNTAYGWGNHADAGYLTSVPVPNLQAVTDVNSSTSNQITITSTTNQHLKLAYNSSYFWSVYREGDPVTGDLVFSTNQNGTVTEGLRVTTAGVITGNGSGLTGVNATLLDGINSSEFIRDYGSTTVSDYNGLAEGIIGTTSTSATNIPYANHNITMTLYNDASSGRKAQLFFGDTPGRFYWRPSQGTSNPPSGWHPWENIVTSSNIGDYALTSLPTHGHSASDLTSGTLQGSFGVTGNISGNWIYLDKASNNNGIHIYAASGGKINWDARDFSINSDTGARIHKWNRNTADTVYLPYYENWYDGNSYHTIGVENNKLYFDGSEVIHSGNISSQSVSFATNADTLDGQHGSYYAQASLSNNKAYTSTGNAAGSYLGGHYSSGGTEKPNSGTFGSGKLKIAMLSNSNLGFGGTWNDVLWISSYNGGDVKRSMALVSSKYDNTSLWLVKQNYDATGWGTGYLIWNSGNDGSGSGLDADLLDGYDWDNTPDITIGGIKLEDSSDRSGLLEINAKPGASSWTGTQAVNGQRWSLMGNNSNFGLYNDSAGEWVYLHYTNAGVDLYYDNAVQLQTKSGYALATNQMRAPIFYDSNSTSYYVDPSGVSTMGFAQFIGDGAAYNARTSTGVSIGRYTSEYAYIELGSTHANGGWIDFSGANGTDYNGRIRHYNSTQQMKFFVNGSSSETLNINTGGINVAGDAIVSGLVYQAAHDASNLAVGWYTIAVNEGNRAVGRFGIRERAGGRHQTAVFYASHHYGARSGITMLHSGFYSGTPFRYIRVKEGGTYDGALLQVYIEDPTNNLDAFLLGDDFQTGGWILKDWVPDGTNPGNVGNFAALTNEAARIDWNDASNGGIIASGNIMAEADVKSRSNMYCTGKYFDWDNTAYFVEAASQSNLVNLVVGSTVLGDGRMAVRGGDLILDRGSQIRWTNTTGSGEYIWSEAGAPYTLHLHSGAYNAVSCPNTGQVYINYNGAARITTTSAGISVTGSLTASGDVLAYSDERTKENIVTVDDPIGKVVSMRGVFYNKKETSQRGVGVIAQEIEKILPEVVTEDEDGIKAVAYGNIVGVLIEAIKEQQKQIEELKAMIK